jgi:hypothetical protein
MKDCGKTDETRELSSTDLHKAEIILEDKTDLVHEKKKLHFCISPRK